jgi:UDP-GlcNAc:undecaprenyl-phosphate GlcNAc-1-phosphate transferase
VVSIGCLLFFFQPVWPAVVFLCVGLVVCTALTLAPLSRRKSSEVAAELTPPDASGADVAARLDPLDAASEGHRHTGTAGQDDTQNQLQQKEKTS